MSRLLYANFFRMFRNRLFLIAMGFMFAAGSFLCFQQYRQLSGYGIAVKLDSTFFAYAIMIGVISAVFCSLFLGTEYSDGTMRNKIIAGHTRTAIYVSNLIVNVAGSLLMCISYMLANVIVGIPLIGTLTISSSKAVRIIAGSFVTVAALCALFTLAGMLIHGKAIAPVVCIVAMFLSIAFLGRVQDMLDEPKYWYDGTLNTTSYVEGAQRDALEFLYNALPAGQEMQYARKDIGNIREMCLYSGGIVLISTAAGVFFFQRKNIK